jgi:AhpD family alkylhydroperoxidase
MTMHASSKQARRTTVERGATVEMVEETAATGRVREIYEDIRRTKQIDFVPNFWKTLAAHPPLLEDTWNRLKRVMAPGALDPLTKEMIAVAVSATNGCSYCINSHTAAAKKLGLSSEALGELMEVVSLFNSTNTLADAFQVRPDVFP